MTLKNPNVLNIPVVEAAHYQQNFIRQAVCELRFPTLFDLDSSKPPLPFAQALRKEYPNYQLLNNLNLSAGAMSKENRSHIFISRQNTWKVSLSSSALTLETTVYSSFDEFQARLHDIIKIGSKIIDAEFFTRVGLRYINTIPYSDDDVREWINPNLVEVMGSGVYGELLEHSQRVAGLTSFGGGYVFQHGLAVIENNISAYTLDLDFYKEDVPVVESMDLIKVMHEQEFAMFTWALGNKAKTKLGNSTIKRSKD